jgi:hypothetical protein
MLFLTIRRTAGSGSSGVLVNKVRPVPFLPPKGRGASFLFNQNTNLVLG